MRAVSVTIITHDVSDHVGAAISSAAWASEIVVLDSGSRDGTPDIAATAGARVYSEPWRGYGSQRNRAAELARCRWILALDADERMDDQLVRSITDLPEEPSRIAFSMRRRNFFAGRPIRHWPWAWDVITRLYDREHASFSSRMVHESLVFDGPRGRIGGTLDHHSYRDWSDYHQRQKRYAQLGAEHLLGDDRRPRPGDTTLRPAASFLSHWLVRGWFLNGVLGARLAIESARGVRMKYLQLQRIHRGARS